MKQQICNQTGLPMAHLCIKKSRLKVYHKETFPTYYLTDGTEFSIELFNPTNDVVLAKISLNDKIISQGGLVINPGQRVFLERYIDIDRTFRFNTYSVNNTQEVKKAIENNGDIKVEFFKETYPYIPLNINQSRTFLYGSHPFLPNPWGTSTIGQGFSTGYSSAGNTFYSSTSSDYTLCDSSPTTKTVCSDDLKKSSNKIETGRVEIGSVSNQKFEIVDKEFAYIPFHTVEYKILPLSQKVNTVKDLKIKRYCVECGGKIGKTDKYCSQCGSKS